MKLRTRLALIAGAVILLASMVGGGLIFRICRRTLLDQAVESAYQESLEVVRGFRLYRDSLGGAMSRQLGAYYLKSRMDDYTVLLEGGEVCYNQTILDPADLGEAASFGREAASLSQGFVGGRRVLAFTFGEEGGFELIHLCDVTGTYFAMYSLAGRIAVISLCVVTVAVLILFVILRRALRPLQALSQGARAMAAGAYGQRVPDSRRDEIGALGHDFNKMAQAVEEHIKEVEDSEEKKTLFMGSLTHELKTPLTAIFGYAQTLRVQKLSEEDKALALGYICQESQRLDRLSKKMLRLLELDREAHLTLEPVPVSEIFQGAAAAMAPAAQAKGVGLIVSPCEGEVEADRDLLTEVVVNLIDNAVKASPPGTAVELYTEDGAMVVEDRGCGIPAEEIGRLTEPFYMVDKSRSRKSGGAGLGLALSAVILRRHGMALHIDSAPGSGTKITIFTI